jgi:hypothetical protein
MPGSLKLLRFSGKERKSAGVSFSPFYNSLMFSLLALAGSGLKVVVVASSNAPEPVFLDLDIRLLRTAGEVGLKGSTVNSPIVIVTPLNVLIVIPLLL